jgi:hypothetical protein
MATGHGNSWQRCQWSEILWVQYHDKGVGGLIHCEYKWQLVTAIHDEAVKSLVCREWHLQRVWLHLFRLCFGFGTDTKMVYVQCVIVNLSFSTNLIDFLHCSRMKLALWVWWDSTPPSLHYLALNLLQGVGNFGFK